MLEPEGVNKKRVSSMMIENNVEWSAGHFFIKKCPNCGCRICQCTTTLMHVKWEAGGGDHGVEGLRLIWMLESDLSQGGQT